MSPRAQIAGPFALDGRTVADHHRLSVPRRRTRRPGEAQANEGKSFQGSIVLGMGFTFDDTDTNGVANPISDDARADRKGPPERRAIFPYIGGEEVNDQPDPAHHRYVINFGEMTDEEARQWPDLMQDSSRRRSNRSGILAESRRRSARTIGGNSARQRPLCTTPSAAWSACWSCSSGQQACRFRVSSEPDWCFAHTLIVFALH